MKRKRNKYEQLVVKDRPNDPNFFPSLILLKRRVIQEMGDYWYEILNVTKEEVLEEFDKKYGVTRELCIQD